MTTLQEAIASGRGVERAFHCHMHDNTNTPAASVNVLLGVWVCYSCGAAGKADGTLSRDADLASLTKSMLTPREQHTYSEAWLDVFDAHHPSPYWLSRVSRETADLYRCGTHPVSGLPTYPIRSINNDVLGVVCRQDGHPKYLYPHGVSVSECLFGYEYAAYAPSDSVLILVEGASDVLAFHSKTRAFAVGVYGAGIKYRQIPAVKRLRRRVLVAFDNDEAGKQATVQTVETLKSEGLYVDAINWPDGVKDAGEVDVDVLMEVINDTRSSHIA